MDLYNSEILSYRISEKPNALAIMEGLEETIQITNDCPFRRTLHSDQGWAYQMNAYKNKLKQHKVFQSMSRKENCLDNSPMENFFGLLKQEIFHGEGYWSFDELKTKIDQYIYYYNHKRIKKINLAKSGSVSRSCKNSCLTVNFIVQKRSGFLHSIKV